ncbi:MAG: U32 family peptidase, partial [Spirochaetaceae bacterium]|nr:U32 family peptidase [Spirochaetaceae bacterium]
MELVSPAGNIEKLKYAYAYGADAAYIGLKKFSLRVKADNFYGEEYNEINALKQQYPGKKLFCALNISFHNKDIENFISDIDYFKLYPFDAFIVQDVGMIPILQKYFPSTALHLSTQANCINREAVKLYKSLGLKRVVLGREASLAEIRQIKDAVPEMELEVFGHGAMCIAYSGRCLMSAYLTARSANSGHCSHACRWEYKLLEEKQRPGEYFPVIEGDDYTAILSSKDLCMIDHLDDMQKAGVDALKIEGRMKSLYYVALVTRAYRKGIDCLKGKITKDEAQKYADEL